MKIDEISMLINELKESSSIIEKISEFISKKINGKENRDNKILLL